ncbi:hypothetical protein [Natronospira bacteriovora]|uniref:Sulfotransferase domain-containing protein n=1 Tax=Natronospira bacteriovora TaxID=3069753 RepID=A0ABU0W8A7_9GAMM|nr:hypothetical protein [Natronospira sp. AB-CW4]MDQ2070148.1 hypothetical protein [Natronospira sp. AB-CW4]
MAFSRLGEGNNLCVPLAAKESIGPDIERYRGRPFLEYKAKVIDRIERAVETARSRGLSQLVISSEHLSSRLICEGDISDLREMFPKEVEFKVIVYLRPQVELALGSIAESVKAGSSNTSILRPSDMRHGKPYQLPYFDYSELLGRWEKVFGYDSLIVRSYEKAQLYQNDVVSDFLFAIGEKAAADKIVPGRLGENRRLSPEAIHVLAAVNKYVNDKKERRFLMSELEAVDDFCTGSVLPDEIVEEYLQYFEHSNHQVAKRYLNSDRLFSDESVQYRSFSVDMSKPEADLVARFLAKIIHRRFGS